MGHVHIIYQPVYPYFIENNIAEINDLYVVPSYRSKGIAKELVLTCEDHVRGKYEKIGLGVGLYKDYGHAQRLYSKMDYIPDGQGLIYDNKSVSPGSEVRVDDDLLIYLTKTL